MKNNIQCNFVFFQMQKMSNYLGFSEDSDNNDENMEKRGMGLWFGPRLGKR